MTSLPLARSIRRRRRYFDRAIRDLYNRIERPVLFSPGCGLMRELGLAGSAEGHRFHRLLATDRDLKTVATVNWEWKGRGVRTRQGEGPLLFGPMPAGSFDLIFVPTLLDHLDDAPARSGIRTLFPLLKPGGRLLMASLRPSPADIAFMDAFMAWSPRGRRADELTGLADLAEEPARCRVDSEPPGDVLYLDLERC